MQEDQQTAGKTTPRDPSTTEVFIQIGTITRLLHDTLSQLGVMPKLQAAAQGLPDARSRLNYIAEKTASAADKVLNSVDQAKLVHAHILEQAHTMAKDLTEDPVKAVASGAVLNFVRDIEASATQADGYLTTIMLAQDFHDLTGQVVAKVVTLANDLESSLVKLLVQVVPEDQMHKVEEAFLSGPVVNPEGRSDVVTSQEQVDDLLASLGF